jgi:hypothetical protein
MHFMNYFLNILYNIYICKQPVENPPENIHVLFKLK